MSFHTWILSNEAAYERANVTCDNVISVLRTLTDLAVNILPGTRYWLLLDLSRIQLLNIIYVYSVLFSDDKR